MTARSSYSYVGIVVMLMLFVAPTSTTVSAQTSTTGTIEGTVTDSNGAVVPDIIVTATSPNLMGTQSSTTGNQGRYRFLNLPLVNTQCRSSIKKVLHRSQDQKLL